MPAHCFAGRQDPDGGDCPDRLGGSLGRLLLTAEEVPEGCDYMVDSTLFPAGTGATAAIGRSEHGTTGMSARILVVPGGRPVRASDPCPGSMHDVAAPGAFRTARRNRPLRVDRRQGVRGKRNDHLAQKAPNGELSEAAKEANRSANRIRQVVERTIYRRPLHAFEQTITAALYITFYVFKTTP
mgnify:CR=1 FL=1